MSALGDLAAVLATTVSEVSYSVSESALNPGAVQTYREEFTVPRGWRATALADVVLASDWLAEYVATKQAEALREVADWALGNALPAVSTHYLHERADRIANPEASA